jgi:hypothetical protein
MSHRCSIQHTKLETHGEAQVQVLSYVGNVCIVAIHMTLEW